MLAGPQYIWGPSGSKLLFTGLLIDMLCMEGGALADDVASGAPNHDVESAQLPLACVGFKNILNFLIGRASGDGRSTSMLLPAWVGWLV